MTPVEQFKKDHEETIERLVALCEQKKSIDRQLKNCRSVLFEKMEEQNIKSFSVPGGRVARTKSTNPRRFNSKKFKKDYPSLYNQYSEPYYKEGTVAYTPDK